MSTVRRIFTVLAAAGVSSLVPAVAQADSSGPQDPFLQPVSDCTIPPSSQVFLQWGDTRTYSLVPGGDFEGSLSDWSLQGGAATMSGDSEPFGVTGSVGSTVLALPAGSVVTAATTCVNVSHPAVRLFTRTGPDGGQLLVNAVAGPPEDPIVLKAGHKVRTPSDWAPTPPLPVHMFRVHDGSNAVITLQFKAIHGTVYIDDVFVDPWRSG